MLAACLDGAALQHLFRCSTMSLPPAAHNGALAAGETLHKPFLMMQVQLRKLKCPTHAPDFYHLKVTQSMSYLLTLRLEFERTLQISSSENWHT